MESIIQGSLDELIPGLSWGSPPTASYLKDRVSSTWYPRGAQTYSPAGGGGTNLLSFTISDPGMGFLDISTIRLAGQLNNTSTTDPPVAINFPHASLMSFMRRVRVMVSGTLIEDIDIAGRLAEMLMKLRPANRNWSDSITGLGASEQIAAASGTGVVAANVSSGFLDGYRSDTLAQGQSRKFLSVILSGFLQTHSWLNVGRHPLTIELELADPTQCTVSGGSRTYNFSNMRLLGDIVHVDSTILEKYNQLLETGDGIPIHFSSYSHTMHNVTGLTADTASNFDLMIQRSFSRLKTVFVTFSSATYRASTTDFTEYNSFVSWHGGGDPATVRYGAPIAYDFAKDNVRVQLAVGPLLFPAYPADSHAELFYGLQKALAMDSSVDGLSFPPSEYRRSTHIEAFDLEKANGSPGSGLMAYTGISTRDTGDAIRLTYQGINADARHLPDRCYVVMHYDAVVLLMREGVQIQN